MKICPNCKVSVVDNAKFCHKCRFNIKKYEEEKESSVLYCIECGAEIQSGASFCIECGADVVGADTNTYTVSENGFDFDAVNSISSMASEQLYKQNGFNVENGVLVSYNGKKRSVTVFGSIEEIYDGAFEGNQIITCVEIEEGIKSIGRKAFASCPSLVEIFIPKSCKILYEDTFENDSLKTLILPEYDEKIIYNCVSALAKKYFDEVDINDFCEKTDGKVYVNIEKIDKNAELIKKYEENKIAEEKRQAQLKREAEEKRKKEEEERIRASKYFIGSVHKIGFYPDRSSSLEWIVIDRDNDKALVITKNIIDCKKFNEKHGETYWGSCTLRSWLNSDFLNSSFAQFEIEKIVTKYVQSTKNPTYKTQRGENTYDKIFLLSIDEANKYFPTSEKTKCTVTPLAKKNGAYCDTLGYGYWWLRTTGEYANEISYIFYSGGVSTKGYDATGTIFGVRPAMWISLA